MTTSQTRSRTFVAPREVRLVVVERARERLPEIVYRTMRLEGEQVSRADAAAAVAQALGR